MSDAIDQQKRVAAARAVDWVESGMVVGLGTGSTAIHAVRSIADRIQRGDLRDIVAIPTSTATEQAALQLGIPLTTLETHPTVDLTIDGADEIDPHFNAIKGGGGALLREKIVAQASQRVIIVVDETKPSPILGTRWALPVEVVTFGWGAQRVFLESLGAQVTLRMSDDEDPFQTDHGNFILDCRFGPIAEPITLARKLESRAGIVEHGLFLGVITDVILATADGIEHRQRAA